MGFIESIKTCFSKYFVFSGRATRPELWYFYLFYIIGIFLAVLGDLALNPELLENDEVGPWEIIFILIMLIPFTSVSIRRLHDVNRSGWWFLIQFTIIGLIPFYYWMVKPSDANSNKYGTNPAKRNSNPVSPISNK